MIVDLLEIFINNILPIFIIAGTGVAVGRWLPIDTSSIGQIAFYIFSPALAFVAFLEESIELGALIELLLLTILFQGLMAIVGYGVALRVTSEPLERAAVTLTISSFNSGNFGISLILFAFGEATLPYAVTIFVGNLIATYTIGVFIAGRGTRSLRDSLFSILKTPVPYTLAAALLTRLLALDLPAPVLNSANILADAAIPVMLVLLGLEVGRSAHVEKPQLVGAGIGARLLISPFVALAMAALLIQDRLLQQTFIVQVSTPTAVTVIVLANEYQLDTRMVANTVILSTLLSPIPLSILIFLLQ